MADAGTRAADKAQSEIERRLRRIYSQAQKEITEKLDKQMQHMRALDAAKRAQRDAGKITDQQYKDWLLGQQFIQKQWRDKVDSVTDTLLHANEQANDIIEGQRRAVFGENATYQAYELEKGYGADVSFSIYDSGTVTRLLREQPELLPRRVVDGKKDKAWNRTQIANAVTHGVIQGESIPQIAKRIAKETASTNMKAMTRYARTAMTGAQNAGRLEAMHDAEDMGIEVLKLWIATLDGHTRDAHARLDGQTAKPNEPFVNQFGEIDYPGDPFAAPANVYNCRCTLGWEYPKYKGISTGARRYDNEAHTEIEDMTYAEWKAAKAQQQQTKARHGGRRHAGNRGLKEEL